MLLRFTALIAFLALILAALTVRAEPGACGIPLAAEEGWKVAQDRQRAGFDSRSLCAAERAFLESPRNLHSFLVERHGELVVDSYRAGPDRSSYWLWSRRKEFDKDALHDVRSITKSIVVLLWGIAEHEGRVPSLSTPVLNLLPTLSDLRSGGRDRITVADMLCMRSGLAWDESGGYSRWMNDEHGLLWRGDRARYIFDRPIDSAPGSQFNYNGGLTAVLGLLLEERAGVDLDEYARKRLFDPLGIVDWEWTGDLRGRTRAFTGLRLRPRDLARIGRLVLDGGRWQGRQVVPEAWVRTLLSPCVSGEAYGHHWWAGKVRVGDKEVAWHGALGNGGQRLFIVPSLDLAVVTTAGEYGEGSIGRVNLHLLQQVVAATREYVGAPSQISEAVRPASTAPTPIETRATLRSVTEEDGGSRTYVYLKIMPKAKVPFTTLRFRVRDRALLNGLSEGATVKFRAERIDGENTLTAIRGVPPCVRFQPCD